MSASKQEPSNVIGQIVAKTRQGRNLTKPYSVDISEMRSSKVGGRGYFLFICRRHLVVCLEFFLNIFILN